VDEFNKRLSFFFLLILEESEKRNFPEECLKIYPQKSVSFVTDLLIGERNGKKIGMMLNTVVKNAD
jgi:hypothetical protein